MKGFGADRISKKCETISETKNHNGSQCNDDSTAAIIANTIISDYRSDEARRHAMEWMRRRCCKKGSGANFFRGDKVEKRDLGRAKEAISERGVKRSESEASRTKNDNKLEMAKKTRNETKNTKYTKKMIRK